MIKSIIVKTSKSILLLLVFFKNYGQVNLVSNSSFEAYTSCPVIQIKPPQSFPWLNLVTNFGSYANSCSNAQVTYPPFGVPSNAFGGGNYQAAHSGYGYLVFKTLISTTPYAGKYRIYQGVPLNDSLKGGKKYYCGFYTVLTDSSNYATNNIAMSITKNIVIPDTNNGKNGNLQNVMSIFNNNNPVIKDTKKWVLVCGIYKAQGGERYITIGNFKDNNATEIDSSFTNSTSGLAVYCLDDVFVYELNNSYCAIASAGKDTTITLGDSVFIGSLINGIDSLQWLQNGILKIDSTRPGFWVKPLVSSFYVLQQTVNGCFSADTVWVNVQPLPLKFISYSLRQAQGDNPSSLRGTKQSVENIWVTANEINVSHFNIQRSFNGRDFINIGQLKAKNKSYNEYSFIDEGAAPSPLGEGWGEVYYRIESIDKDGKKQYSETKRVTLNEKQETSNIVLFPNPAKDFVTVECKGAKKLLIIDCLGRVVYKQTLRQAQNDNKPTTTINVQGLNEGLYLVKVITNNGEIKTEKLIFQ